MTDERQLSVIIETTLIGVIRENNGLWSFQYDEKWLRDSAKFPLTPSLTLREEPHIDTGSKRPVQWFFDNLLPEEGARELIARDNSLDKDDAFSMLESVGSETAGALTLLPPGAEIPEGGLASLPRAELNERIKKLPHAQLNNKQHKRMSIAGAQHKMLLVIDQGEYYEPIGQTPSTHILKPEHQNPDQYWCTVRNEYFCMRLAQSCGLTVPNVSIDYVPAPVYLIERFDRIGQYPRQERLHVLDGCQVLDISAQRKYRASHAGNLKKLAKLSRQPAKTIINLFKWVVFNYLIGNGDAHLKNISFRYGTNDCVLMPHYDLLSTAVYENGANHMHAELSQPLGGATTFGDVTIKHLLQFASEIGMPEKLAIKEVRELTRLCLKHSRAMLETLQQQPSYPEKGAEIRLISHILHRCIGEFSQKIMP